MPQGLLQVTVVKAEKLQDTEFFGKQDPYAVLTVGSTRQTTSVSKDTGKKANWNETFQFQLQSEQTLLVEVYNKNSLRSDDLIGRAQYALAKVFSTGRDSCWLTLSKDKGHASGTVELGLSFHSQGASGHYDGRAPGSGYPIFGGEGQVPPSAPFYPPQGPAAFPTGAGAGPSCFQPAYPPGPQHAPPATGVPSGYNPPPPQGYPTAGGGGYYPDPQKHGGGFLGGAGPLAAGSLAAAGLGYALNHGKHKAGKKHKAKGWGGKGWHGKKWKKKKK
mmetsp:Transcript_29574/g.70446  ORF Transcript_29574/g.70446 Transcript_29574/m.70446 type:complete len:275 (-) Transcript_29574:237-1061(-)